MYPYIRLFKVLLTSRFKSRISFDSVSELKLRVWPGDIDFYPEMNNGRHLTLMDLGRMDLAARSGLIRAAHQNGWGFVVAGASVRFRRKLTPFRAFTLRTELIGVDHRWFYFLQTTRQNGLVCSSALVRGAVRSKDGLIPIQDVLEAIGEKYRAMAPPDWVQAWIKAEELRPML